MALFLTAVLALSSIAMVVLLWVKHWELSTGRMAFGSLRPRAGALLDTYLMLLQKRLPALVSGYKEQIAIWLRTSALNV